jgi:glycosyltransferase involved in cell wall biosynthesis
MVSLIVALPTAVAAEPDAAAAYSQDCNRAMAAFPATNGSPQDSDGPAEESPRRRARHVCILFHESAILGAGVSVLRAAGCLRRRGWRISGWFPSHGPLVTESGTVLHRSGWAVKPIAFSLGGWRRDPGIAQRLRRTPGYLGAFRKWLEETAPDVVHVNSLLMLPEATIARRHGLPIVVQLHEVPPRGAKRDLTLRWAAAIADVLIGVSRPVTRLLAEHAGSTPVLTVHSGVPSVDARPPPKGKFIIGSIGHVSRTKGTDVFLEAAALALRRRPELRFEHAGPTRPWGDDEFEDSVERTAESSGLRDALTMLGYRPARDLLRDWSLFVLPSRQEGFPLSTLEAMAAGVPVIATNVGGIPEQIVHLESGVLVPPEDADALAEWIERLYADGDLRMRLATAGRSRARSVFPLEAQAEGLLRAYEQALRFRAQT